MAIQIDRLDFHMVNIRRTGPFLGPALSSLFDLTGAIFLKTYEWNVLLSHQRSIFSSKLSTQVNIKSAINY